MNVTRSKESHVEIIATLLSALNDVLLLSPSATRESAEKKIRAALKAIQEDCTTESNLCIPQ